MKYSNITLSSILVGGIDGICTCPLDNLKTRCHLSPSTSLIHSYGGTLSLFNGLLPYTSQIIVKTAVRFTMYNETLEVLMPICSRNEHAVVVAGLLAGITEGFLCTTPLERIKIHSQILGYPNFSIQGIHDIVRTHGFMSLWQGWLPTVLKQGTSLATRFLTFDKIHTHFVETTKYNEHVSTFIAGGLAGIFSIILNNPFDVIKTSIQSGQTRGFWSTIHILLTTQGSSMIYSGLCFRIPRVFISQGITFSIYQMFSGI